MPGGGGGEALGPTRLWGQCIIPLPKQPRQARSVSVMQRDFFAANECFQEKESEKVSKRILCLCWTGRSHQSLQGLLRKDSRRIPAKEPPFTF